MGIPAYFSHVVKKYRNIIKNISSIPVIHNLYLDCNSIIYDVIRQSKYLPEKRNEFENDVMVNICKSIDNCIYLIKPKNRVFIAFDGVAPVAKLNQQRERRYKSWYIQQLSKKILKPPPEPEWNTSAITPGTEFMNNLHNFLYLYYGDYKILDQKSMQQNKYKLNGEIIISSSKEVGEGEHKIYEFIRKNSNYHKDTTSLIYGLDADLIMLTLNHLHISKNLYLYRETPEFIKSIDSTLDAEGKYYLDIPEFANALTLYINNDIEPNSEQQKNRLFDYIFICFMLGNDFMPHFPSLNIRTNGINNLLHAYRETIGKTDENLTDGNIIYWKNVKKLISYLANNELTYLMKEHNLRDRLSRNIKQDENDKIGLNLLPLKNRELELYINPYEKGWEFRYYNALFDLKINDQKKMDICTNYLEGLEWTFRYYTTGCVDWRWTYKYHYAPLLIHLLEYIPVIETTFITEKNTESISEIIQLCYVLPRASHNLLPKEIENKLMKYAKNKFKDNANYEFKWAYCKYFYECHTELPELNIDTLTIQILEV